MWCIRTEKVGASQHKGCFRKMYQYSAREERKRER